MRFTGNGGVSFTYGGQEIKPATIRAAWFRRSTDSRPAYHDPAKELCLSREQRESQDLLFRSVPPEAWLNSPTNMECVEHKMWQLREAETFGFIIPRTTVSNSWQDVATYFDTVDKITFKMPFGELFVGNTLKTMSAKVFTKSQLQHIKGLPFPGICQEYVAKKREWRVTVVGEQVFAAAIYTHEKAKADWREHQRNKDLVQFKSGKFPKKVSDQCIGFLKHLGLRFDAFDFYRRRIWLNRISRG